MHVAADRVEVEAPLTGVTRSLLTGTLKTDTETWTVHSDAAKMDTDTDSEGHSDTDKTGSGG